MTTDDLEVTANAFSEQARRVCSIIESAPNAERSAFLRELHAALANLYARAIELPLVEPETDQGVDGNVTDDEWEALVLRLAPYLDDADAYWEVFDPYNRNDPVSGSLSDDLADIYRDVRRGLDMLDSGAPLNEVLWIWRFDFWNHWSDHAAGALRALTYAARRTEI